MVTQLASSHLLFAILTGLLPSVLWLFFWRRTDRDNPEPFGLLLLCFFLGAVSVLIATVLQHWAKPFLHTPITQIMVWAGIEEVLKLLAFVLIAMHSAYDDEPLDAAIYMIAVALGFAALENIFYVLHPQASFNVTAALLTGSLRFFGSTLLHAISSGFIGLCIGLSDKAYRGIAIALGLVGAIFLHSTFNFFILKNDAASFLQIYGYLWVAAIISHLIMEKLRRLPAYKTT